MPRECTECGIGSRGAFLVDVDDETYCTSCVPEQDCERCGRLTTDTMLSGAFRCEDCQESERSKDRMREDQQAGLGAWS